VREVEIEQANLEKIYTKNRIMNQAENPHTTGLPVKAMGNQNNFVWRRNTHHREQNKKLYR